MASNVNPDRINSVVCRDGKIVINNEKEFLIKKKPIWREESDQRLIVTLDNVENEAAVIHLLDEMPQLEGIEPNSLPSYLSDGSYMIAYVDEGPLSQEEIVSYEPDLTEESPLLETFEQKVTDTSDAEVKMDVEVGKVELPPTETSPRSNKPPQKRVKSGKRGCCCSEDEDSTSETEWEDIPSPYATKVDLVNNLLERELIDEEFKDLILKGFSEMKIDIMEVLMDVSREKHPFELLTFAYLLFYKKRRAYFYLQKVYSSQWPTKTDLRDWRKIMNSEQIRNSRLKRKQQAALST